MEGMASFGTLAPHGWKSCRGFPFSQPPGHRRRGGRSAPTTFTKAHSTGMAGVVLVSRQGSRRLSGDSSRLQGGGLRKVFPRAGEVFGEDKCASVLFAPNQLRLDPCAGSTHELCSSSGGSRQPCGRLQKRADRFVESLERHGSTLLQVLDWTQALQAVTEALTRHGVTLAFVDLVVATYRAPAFTVRAMGETNTCGPPQESSG